MSPRSRVLWSVSAVLLAWLLLMTWHGRRLDACAAEGGRWDARHWRCDLDFGRIILERGLRRS